MLRQPFEETDGLCGLSFVEKQLGELLEGRLVLRLPLQDAPESLLGLFRSVLQAVEAREPECRLDIRWIEAQNLSILLGGVAKSLRLARSAVQVPQAAEVDARQQPPRRQIVWIAIKNFHRLLDGIADALRLPVHLRQALPDHRRGRIQGVSLLVILQGLRGILLLLLLLRRFKELFRIMAHCEVIVGIGTLPLSRVRCRLALRSGWRRRGLCRKSRREQQY